MTDHTDFMSINFDLPKNQSNVIKVIGVGGGGSNAINHMFKQGIKGVDFIVCNTDSQALQNSPVPNKIQLGINLTEGMGAGANPTVGQQSAIESIADIEKMLDSNTKMIFITAGMGGGTGTGAAPVIAQLAREKHILTVGIVTMPFLFEGKIRSEQAAIGIEKLRKHVDSLIVINNNKLREVYGNLGFKAGFSKADEVLATASRGIAEVITHHYTQNIDLKDAKTVLANSGTAIMGSSSASGENRAKEAIIAALDSPLLNDNKISGAKNVLLLIVSGQNEITIDEIGEISDYIQAEAGFNANIIMGVGEDESLDESIAVTIIATGFNVEQQNEIVNTEPKKIIHILEDSKAIVTDLMQKPVLNLGVNFESEVPTTIDKTRLQVQNSAIFDLPTNHEINKNTPLENELIEISNFIKNIDVSFDIVPPQDFVLTTPDINNIKVIDFEIVKPQEPLSLTFDLPLNNVNSNPAKVSVDAENSLTLDFDGDLNNIKVIDTVHLTPVTDLTDSGVIKYSLEEYMEVEGALSKSKPIEQSAIVEESLNITVKKLDEDLNALTTVSDLSAMEMTIEETMRLKAEERRRKLKTFNYKFHTSKIDEYEKTPAYVRSGVDLTKSIENNQNSRYSVGLDSNNDSQLRSNNSFLHDSVD